MFCVCVVPKVQPIGCPLYTCRSPLPHGADQGPENSGASGGKLEDAGTRAGPVLQCIGHN